MAWFVCLIIFIAWVSVMVHVYFDFKASASALEALRTYRRSKAFGVGTLLHFARICRVERVLRPYLEAML